MKYVLDTSIYLGAFQSEERKARFRNTFFPLLPGTYLASVVAYELFVNAQDRQTRDLLRDYINPMERTGRIVAPGFEDWIEASEIVTAITQKGKSWRSKLPALLNDILIALCARRIGATLITYNRGDFLLIRRHKDFLLRILVD
jgi:predicted nucleic acid-binding protein